MTSKSSPYATRFIYLRDLVRELVVREIKTMYKGSVLGVAWSLIHPLVLLLVFQFVFGVAFPMNIPHFGSFVFIGILTWTWFQSSLIQSSASIRGSRDLIRRPGFPSIILPLVTVTTHFIYFLFALPVLITFLAVFGPGLNMMILVLPVIIILQFILTLSLAYFIAAVSVLFRDVQHILQALLQVLFFLSPIFYDVALVPEAYQPLYNLNPLVHLLEAYRAVLLGGVFPNYLPILAFWGLASGLLVLGLLVYPKVSNRFVEEV